MKQSDSYRMIKTQILSISLGVSDRKIYTENVDPCVLRQFKYVYLSLILSLCSLPAILSAFNYFKKLDSCRVYLINSDSIDR